MFCIGRTSGVGTSGALSLSSTFHESPAFADVTCHSKCSLRPRRANLKKRLVKFHTKIKRKTTRNYFLTSLKIHFYFCFIFILGEKSLWKFNDRFVRFTTEFTFKFIQNQQRICLAIIRSKTIIEIATIKRRVTKYNILHLR